MSIYYTSVTYLIQGPGAMGKSPPNFGTLEREGRITPPLLCNRSRGFQRVVD